jgi:hypothetical protein
VANGEETLVADAVETVQIGVIRDCRILVQSIAKIIQVRSGTCQMGNEAFRRLKVLHSAATFFILRRAQLTEI